MSTWHSGRRTAVGAVAALAGIGMLTAVMLPFREHLSVATTALVLVVPVAGGAAIAGFAVGVLAATAGFLTYDMVFIKPYGTLDVGAGENWVALAVYLAVVLVVARLVAFLGAARDEARLHEENTRRLSQLNERLLADLPLPDLLEQVLNAVEEAFHPRWAAVVLPEGDSVRVVAAIGEPADDELRLATRSGRVQHLGLTSARDPARSERSAGPLHVALSMLGRPIGILALSELELDAHERELLRVYADQAAHAIERSRLRDAQLRTQALEASDRWRRALLDAVSHDLRTPLATIKTAVTTVRDSDGALVHGDRDELLALIEAQSDRLARLVTNLLDVSRIESGTLQLQREPTAVEDIVLAAIDTLGDTLATTPVVPRISPDLPPVDVDELLMVQALANLLENAARHSPLDASVEVEALGVAGEVAVSVRDRGPGVPAAERARIFEMGMTSAGAERAGLGLTIARAFVHAHGQRIGVDDADGGGARFSFTMPIAVPDRLVAAPDRLVAAPDRLVAAPDRAPRAAEER